MKKTMRHGALLFLINRLFLFEWDKIPLKPHIGPMGTGNIEPGGTVRV